MFKNTSDSAEIVFSIMDFVVVVLIMIATIIWFRSKHVARFYEACKVGDLETIEKHLDEGQSWMSKLSAKEICVGLMWASSNNMTSVISRLMECPSIYGHKTSLASCLMCACKRGNVDCVRILLSDIRVPLDIINKAGQSPSQLTDNQKILRILQEEKKRSVKYFSNNNFSQNSYYSQEKCYSSVTDGELN